MSGDFGDGGLRVGFALTPERGPEGFRAALARAERGEALGLHSVWLPEGHFAREGLAAPLVLLGAIAARTRALRLATTSLLLPVHPPRRLAGAIAAVDRLSGGRLLVGLGRGFRRDLFDAFGVDPRLRRDRFDRALEAMRRLWAEGGAPAPLQRPHPPLLVAAFGPRGLAQAARWRLPYLASPVEPLEALVRNQAHWRRHLPAPVEGGAPRAPVMRTVHVAGNDAEARRVREALLREAARLRRRAPAALARRLGSGPPPALVGTAPRVQELVERYREALGMDLLVARTAVPGASERELLAAFERLPALARPPLRRSPAARPG